MMDNLVISSKLNTLRPFFSYYGGKWRAALRYPKPLFDTIIEPFAGSAGYSLRYPNKQVILYDIDPIICGIWEYLIKAKEHEIKDLPLKFDHIDELVDIPQEAKNLLGFWINKGVSTPMKSPSKWMRDPNYFTNCQFWGSGVRERIANQVGQIRHWKIYNKSYNECPRELEATWFIDPPYNNEAGKRYRCSKVDYNDLSNFCLNTIGQTIVCEQLGANWLPFRDFGEIKSAKSRVSKEVVYIR